MLQVGAAVLLQVEQQVLVIILRAGAVEVDCGAIGRAASVKLDML